MGAGRIGLLLFLVAGQSAAQDLRSKQLCVVSMTAARQAANLPQAWPEVEEAEPQGMWGVNDSHASAQWIAHRGANVQGRLSPPASAAELYLSEEAVDDGSIPLARDIGIAPGVRIRVHAEIGDGPHGSRAGATGDYDVYRVGELRPGQRFVAAISTPEGSLDTKIGLFDATGALIDRNDNGLPGVPDSFLDAEVATAGLYYLIVRGINMAWPGDPFDPASGPKVGSEGPYILDVGIDAADVDIFSFDARAGDVISANVAGQARMVTLLGPAAATLMGAEADWSLLYPSASPLLRGGNANVARAVEGAGRYAIVVESGEGDYTLQFRLFAAGLPARQVLFLDFDGETIDTRILGGLRTATLSPLKDFLAPLGLGRDARALMDAVVAVVQENLSSDFAAAAGVELDIIASHRHADPWGAPHVSRVIVGGRASELGINTVGIAESVDVGNFVMAETAVVLLDVLMDPRRDDTPAAAALRDGVSLVDVMAKAIGNIASHEAGHLFANFHTGHPDYEVSLMDAGRDYLVMAGSGADRMFGTADDQDVDFGHVPYREEEGFTGMQDTRAALVIGLGVAVPTGTEEAEAPDVADGLGQPYPHPASGPAYVPISRARRASVALGLYDILGRRVETLYEGVLSAGTHHVAVDFAGVAPGLYLLRAAGSTRAVVVGR